MINRALCHTACVTASACAVCGLLHAGAVCDFVPGPQPRSSRHGLTAARLAQHARTTWRDVVDRGRSADRRVRNRQAGAFVQTCRSVCVVCADQAAQVAHVLHRFKGGKKGKGRVYIFDYPKGARCHADPHARAAHDRGARRSRAQDTLDLAASARALSA